MAMTLIAEADSYMTRNRGNFRVVKGDHVFNEVQIS